MFTFVPVLLKGIIGMNQSNSILPSFAKHVSNMTGYKSLHHKKDVLLRIVKLSGFAILVVIVLFLIYHVRILYHQHLRYQRLQRDETEVSIAILRAFCLLLHTTLVQGFGLVTWYNHFLCSFSWIR